MGEHGTWFDYLDRFSWWRALSEHTDKILGRHTSWPILGDSGWGLTHVLVTLLVLSIVVIGGVSFYRGMTSGDRGVVPPRTMNLRNFFEYLTESVYGMCEGALGEENAPKFLPLIGALWLFILFSNLIGLIPGFIPPTDTLKTNVGIALLVFLLTHYFGLRAQGISKFHSTIARVSCVVIGLALVSLAFNPHPPSVLPTWAWKLVGACGAFPLIPGLIGYYPVYFKHFLGPVWWLIPLMLPIELIGHLARPVSLSMRLMGNMLADHKVVLAFFAMVPILVPVPFMLLGILVCVIQAFVFCTLAMVYIGMAMEHEEEH